MLRFGGIVVRTLDRSAIFVDAGYLFASGSNLVLGERRTRSQLHLDHDAVLTLLARLSAELTGLPLLRIYWYDGASATPSSAHVALAYRENVKLRLGTLDEQGQHGVDELLAGDLTKLAQQRAMADALLLSGDDDLREAVEVAQGFGVRVHLLGIAPQRENQAAALVQAADTLRELSEPEVRGFLSARTK